MGNRKGFMMYLEWCDAIAQLPAEKQGQMLSAMAEFTRTDTEPQFTDSGLQGMWVMFRGKMSRDRERYEQTCRMRREAANKRWEKAEKPAPKRSGYNMTRQEMDDGMDKYLDW